MDQEKEKETDGSSTKASFLLNFMLTCTRKLLSLPQFRENRAPSVAKIMLNMSLLIDGHKMKQMQIMLLIILEITPRRGLRSN